MADARPVHRRAGMRVWLGGGWLALLFLTAIFAGFLSPHDPLAQDLTLQTTPPGWLAGAEPGYALGTDSLGRDVLSRVIYARGRRSRWRSPRARRPASSARCSVCSPASSAAGPTGSSPGSSTSGWRFRPFCCRSCWSRCWAPALSSVIIAIAVIDWTRFCRVVRAEAMQQRRMDYVDSAKVAGYGTGRILWREVLPNVAPAILVLFSLEMGIAVIVEAILSFVGLSISSDAPTWGGMIAEGRGRSSTRPGGCWCRR